MAEPPRAFPPDRNNAPEAPPNEKQDRDTSREKHRATPKSPWPTARLELPTELKNRMISPGRRHGVESHRSGKDSLHPRCTRLLHNDQMPTADVWVTCPGLSTNTLDFSLRDRSYNVIENLPNISFTVTID